MDVFAQGHSMGDLLEDDDFGDFVAVAPSATRSDSFSFGASANAPPATRGEDFSFGDPVRASTATRVDSFSFEGPTTAPSAIGDNSFDFGGPAEPVASGLEASQAQSKAPTPSELMLSMHGLKRETRAAFTKPEGALPDIFGEAADLSFAQPQTPLQPSVLDTTPGIVPPGAQEPPLQNYSKQAPMTDDDWGDFASPEPPLAEPKTLVPPAEPKTPLPPVKTSKTPPLLSSFGVQSFGQGPLRTQSPRRQSPKSAELRLSKKHSPQSSPKRSSPLSRRSSLESKERRSSLEPKVHSPHNATLLGPSSKLASSPLEATGSSPRSTTLPGPSSKPAASYLDSSANLPCSSIVQGPLSKPAPKTSVVLIGNLMPPVGARSFKERKPMQDVNQARFAMAAGLASEWASDFKDEERASEVKAERVQAPVVDLMDWGDEPAANGTPSASNDDDFGDDFGDFVSATSSTSTSRRTSDMDFLSTIDPPLVSSGPSKAAAPPNGLSSTGVSGDLDFSWGDSNSGAMQAKRGSLEGFKEELVQKPSSGDPFPDISRWHLGATGPADRLSDSENRNPEKKRMAESDASVFAGPLSVDLGTSVEGAKTGCEASTPKSTLHTTAPPLFPDSASPNGLSSKGSTSPSPLVRPKTAVNVSSPVSEVGSEKSSLTASGFGVSETGRLSRSIFGEESDDESKPLPQLGVQTEAKRPPPPAASIEALLNGNAYEASIGKALSGMESPKSGASLSGAIDRSPRKAASVHADCLQQDRAPVPPQSGHMSSARGVPSPTSTAPSLDSLGSFAFGAPVVSPQQNGLELESLPSVGIAGQGVASEPFFDDDDFGDFESASVPESSGAPTPASEGLETIASTIGEVAPGSAALDDALFGDYTFPEAPSSDQGANVQHMLSDKQQVVGKGEDPFGGIGTSRTESTSTGLELLKRPSGRPSQNGSVDESEGLGRVSGGLMDLDLLLGGNELSRSTAGQGDPFLDLLGMEASSSGAPGETAQRRRSFSARRERREHSRRSSDAAFEEGSVRNNDSWQEITPQKLERSAGSGGSGKRRSYKESDLLEVGMQLLEQGRLAEARACRAHLEAQKRLPEKKAQYERAMIESPMKAFDVMKDIHGLEGALASSHEVAKWQQASMGSRRSSLSKRPELSRTASIFRAAEVDVPLEGQQAFVRAWEDLAHVCADELEEGQEIWQEAVDAKCDQELLCHPKGRQYFAFLCRVYFVSALLSCLCRWRKPWLLSAGDSAEGLQSCLVDCRRTADGSLKRPLKAVSDGSKGLGFGEVLTTAQSAVLAAAVSKSQRQAVCTLTLVPQSALEGVLLVSWQGRTFVSLVANLWANRISTTAPQLLSI